MKSLKLFCMTALAAVTLLTSCIGDTKNEQSGAAYGVITGSVLSTKKISAYDLYNGPFVFYADRIQNDENLQPGSCVYFSYEVNWDSEENADVANKGYVTAQVGQYMYVGSTSLGSVLRDTTQMIKDELAIKELNLLVMWEKRLFIEIYFDSSYKNGQVNSYSFSYDPEQEPTIEDGKEVYELFLRAQKLTDGNATSTFSGELYAMDFSQFISRFESKGKVKFKINYPTEFDKEEETISKWGTTKAVELNFSTTEN